MFFTSHHTLPTEKPCKWHATLFSKLLLVLALKKGRIFNLQSGFGGLEVSVLASGTRVRGFKTWPKPSDFSGEKILSTPSFRGEVKPLVPCRKFRACKRTQKWRGSRHFWKNSWQFLTYSSIFHCWGSLASFQTGGEGGGHPVLGVGTFWSLVLQVGGLTCRWQRHSLKTSLLRILNDSWAGQNSQGLQCWLKKKKI